MTVELSIVWKFYLRALNVKFCKMEQHRKLQIEEMHRITVEQFKAAPKTPIIIILDNIRSLNNVGSIFRTCDALRAERIVLVGITSTPPNPEIHKTALGAEFSVEWQQEENILSAIENLRAEGCVICSVEQAEGSISLPDFHIEDGKKYALILGNEVKGVQQQAVDASDYCIEIPQFGTKHSFNVAVTAGIVMWELFRQLKFGR